MKKEKKILITTYIFPPSNSPRAFRIIELIKYFSKEHCVTVVTPDIGEDYSSLEEELGIKIILVKKDTGVYSSNHKTPAISEDHKIGLTGECKRFVKPFLRKLITYFLPDGLNILFSIKLYKKLKELKDNDFDVIISNSHPFCVHIGTALYLRKTKNIVSIAESGDPYYFNIHALAPYQLLIEKWVLSQFSFISVPTEKALPDYKKLNQLKKVHVIPHAFDISNIRRATPTVSEEIRISFAGRLYSDIRNPTKFLSYLYENHKDTNYKITFYTNLNNADTMDILTPFMKKLGHKLVINHLIPRDDCIYELSKSDFLVNFSNHSPNQLPSKLIDYTLTKRPFINIDNNFDNKKELERFLSRDYSTYKERDLSKHDIKYVGRLFTALF